MKFDNCQCINNLFWDLCKQHQHFVLQAFGCGYHMKNKMEPFLKVIRYFIHPSPDISNRLIYKLCEKYVCIFSLNTAELYAKLCVECM